MRHFCKTLCLTGLVLLYCATSAAALIFATTATAEPVAARRTSKMVARFIFYGASASRPVGNGKVRVHIGDRVFAKKTNSKGWLVLNVPCNTKGRVVFGDKFEHSQEISVQCSRKPVGLGVFSWRDGERSSDDMNNIDGCRLCE